MNTLPQIHSPKQFEALARSNGWHTRITASPTDDPEKFGRITLTRVVESSRYLEAGFGSEYLIPNLKGRTRQEILDLFGASRFVPEFNYIEITDVKQAGKVIQQSLRPGQTIRANQAAEQIKLRLTLLRLKPVPMPDLIGKTVEEADRLLAGSPAKIWQQMLRVKTNVLALHNRIQRQNPPAGTMLNKFTWVGLFLYDYVGKVTVPRVTNLSSVEVINKLRALALVPQVITIDLPDFYREHRYDPEYRHKPLESLRSLVTGQRVAAGSQVTAGSKIGIEVLTPRFTTLPTLVGQSCNRQLPDTIRQLITELGGYGVIVSNEHVSDPAKNNIILRTVPSAGAKIETFGRVQAVCGRTANLIPDLLGKTEAEGRSALMKLGISKIYVGYYPSNKFPDGQIYNVLPAAGTIIKTDTQVSLAVSKHTGGVTIPSLIGKTGSEARKILEELGFKQVVSYHHPYQRNDPAIAGRTELIGKVEDVHPDPGQVTYDLAAPIEIFIADWAESQPVEVPNVGLMKEAAAVAILKMRGLVPELHYRITTDATLAGTASSRSEPAAYTKVEKGSTVTITIYTLHSKVPSLVQFSEADAIIMLAARQLKAQVEYRTTDNKFAADKVVEQQPTKYSLVTPGTTVKLVVSRYSGMTRLPDWFGRLALRSLEDADVKAGLDYLKTEKKLHLVTRSTDTVLTSQVGKISRTEPAAGMMVKEGSSITIYLYRLLSAVPKVTGQTETGARKILEPLGFAVKVIYTQDGVPGEVSFQSQKPGAAPDHAAITLLVGQSTIAPQINKNLKLSAAAGDDLKKITTFYQTFKDAYESKNESLVMNLISGDWSSGDGADLMDMEDNLRNMFSVFDDIQYDISGLSVQKSGSDLYNVSYSVTIRGVIFDNDLTHEESSTVNEQVIINSSGKVKIYKTLGGNYWSVQ